MCSQCAPWVYGSLPPVTTDTESVVEVIVGPAPTTHDVDPQSLEDFANTELDSNADHVTEDVIMTGDGITNNNTDNSGVGSAEASEEVVVVT